MTDNPLAARPQAEQVHDRTAEWLRENLRALIARRGFNTVTLGARLDRHPTWVTNRLKGRTGFTLADLAELAVALEVPVATLVQEPTS